jgi:hypothetical protein
MAASKPGGVNPGKNLTKLVSKASGSGRSAETVINRVTNSMMSQKSASPKMMKMPKAKPVAVVTIKLGKPKVKK